MNLDNRGNKPQRKNREEKDPNAMDTSIGALTEKEKTALMKIGASVERLPRQEQEQRRTAGAGISAKEIHTKGYSWEYQKFDKGRVGQTHGPDDCR